jgi:hypothetical protein
MTMFDKVILGGTNTRVVGDPLGESVEIVTVFVVGVSVGVAVSVGVDVSVGVAVSVGSVSFVPWPPPPLMTCPEPAGTLPFAALLFAPDAVAPAAPATLPLPLPLLSDRVTTNIAVAARTTMTAMMEIQCTVLSDDPRFLPPCCVAGGKGSVMAHTRKRRDPPIRGGCQR